MKLVEMKVNEFVDLMASDEPAPGGGSAATGPLHLLRRYYTPFPPAVPAPALLFP